MALYSLRGEKPAELPVRITIPAEFSASGSRETRTKLDTLNNDELRELGLHLVEEPTYDALEYDMVWNSTEIRYDLVAIEDAEKAARAVRNTPDPVADYADFESRFASLEVFRKLYNSEVPFLIQLACEIRLMIIYRRYSESIVQEVDVPNLQQGIDILCIIEEAGVTKEDRDNFISNMRLANLDADINIPSDEWIEHHWFENTGNIHDCIKSDTANIGGD